MEPILSLPDTGSFTSIWDLLSYGWIAALAYGKKLIDRIKTLEAAQESEPDPVQLELASVTKKLDDLIKSLGSVHYNLGDTK